MLTSDFCCVCSSNCVVVNVSRTGALSQDGTNSHSMHLQEAIPCVAIAVKTVCVHLNNAFKNDASCAHLDEKSVKAMCSSRYSHNPQTGLCLDFNNSFNKKKYQNGLPQVFFMDVNKMTFPFTVRQDDVFMQITQELMHSGSVPFKLDRAKKSTDLVLIPLADIEAGSSSLTSISEITTEAFVKQLKTAKVTNTVVSFDNVQRIVPEFNLFQVLNSPFKSPHHNAGPELQLQHRIDVYMYNRLFCGLANSAVGKHMKLLTELDFSVDNVLKRSRTEDGPRVTPLPAVMSVCNRICRAKEQNEINNQQDEEDLDNLMRNAQTCMNTEPIDLQADNWDNVINQGAELLSQPACDICGDIGANKSLPIGSSSDSSAVDVLVLCDFCYSENIAPAPVDCSELEQQQHLDLQYRKQCDLQEQMNSLSAAATRSNSGNNTPTSGGFGLPTQLPASALDRLRDGTSGRNVQQQRDESPTKRARVDHHVPTPLPRSPLTAQVADMVQCDRCGRVWDGNAQCPCTIEWDHEDLDDSSDEELEAQTNIVPSAFPEDI